MYIYIYIYICIYIYIYIYMYIAQSVRASERNSVVAGSNPSQSGQLSIATSKNPSVVNTVCIYICIY